MESISQSVGKNGKNIYKDVCAIQTLLNNNIHKLVPFKYLEVDGKCGKQTIELIEEFQKRVVMLKEPDGRVDPGGKTLRSLDTNAKEPAVPFRPFAFAPTSLCFPLSQRPKEDYKKGMRKFGANRKGGRKHAGIDLYAPVGTPIYAIDDGEVTAGPYAFYLGTQALEVTHPQFVARYGEIRGAAPGIKKGSKVKKGQLIAYVGELKGLNMSMLHLELYSGTASGSLTVRGSTPYQRRADLIDPTTVMDNSKCK